MQDQYLHPVESLHTIDEVLNWFKLNNIEYISSIPSCEPSINTSNKITIEKATTDVAIVKDTVVSSKFLTNINQK